MKVKNSGKACRILLSLICCLCLIAAGCSSAAEPVPADLQFFTEDLEGKSRDEIREAFREIVRTTVEAQNQPYLISRLSKIKGEQPQYDEKGKLTGFKSVPLTDADYRVVFPGVDEFQALSWNVSNFQDLSMIAWRMNKDFGQKATWEENDPASYVRDYLASQENSTNLANLYQRQWVSEMFTTGFYKTTRGRRVLSYSENPTIFPANTDHFKFEVSPASEYFENMEEEQEEAQNSSESDQTENAAEEAEEEESVKGDYVLKISTREPQRYAGNLKSANLHFLQSAGAISADTSFVYKDYTFMKYEVTVLLNSKGVIEKVIVRENIRFTATIDKEDISAREECLSIWTIDPYPQAAEKGYPEEINTMLEGNRPNDPDRLLHP